MKRLLTLAALMILTTSCLLPRAPKWYVVKDTEIVTQHALELHTMNQEDIHRHQNRDHSWDQEVKTPNRNLLLVAVDETVQTRFQGKLKEVYNSEEDIRLEDVTWWRFAPKMKGLYDKVLRIPYDRFHKESLFDSLEYMEQLGKDYDVFILTHGIPNHLTSSRGFNFISYEDLAELPYLDHLKTVFMQNCFGTTLIPDWIFAGADHVLAYDGWNRNFFYVDYFLKYLKGNEEDPEKAWKKTNEKIQGKMRRSFLYKKIIKEMGLTMDQYFEIAPNPIYERVQAE